MWSKTDIDTELLGDDLESVDYMALEEMLADTYAGISGNGTNIGQMKDKVRTWMQNNHVEQDFFRDNGTEQPTGPPAGQKENTAKKSGERYAIDERFEERLNAWDGKTIGFSFVVGETSAALQQAGVPKKQIRWDASKIAALLKKHGGMTIETVKQIPGLLERPIIVIDSKKGENAKIAMGELYDEHGNVVTAVLLLTSTSKKGNVLDILKISSAEGRSHIKSLFTYDDGSIVPVRYVDKKRIQNWLNVNRLQLPLHNLGLDSNNIIENQI